MSGGRSDEPVRAYVGLGSNLGDRLAYLRHAVARLAAHPCVCLRGASRLVQTSPIGPPQGPYLNAVIALDTTLPPDGLLALCQLIERAGRRGCSIHWGPRTIDLDVIDFGGLVAEGPGLRLPHPELANRPFVLAPLQDVAPEWRHPVTGDTVGAMRGRLGSAGGAVEVVARAEAWCPPGLLTPTVARQ